MLQKINASRRGASINFRKVWVFLQIPNIRMHEYI